MTPLEVAEAYTVFANRGTVKKLRALINITSGEDVPKPKVEAGPTVARPTSAFLVTHMMRSVLNEGTGAAARANGFSADAAGKSGTTNDLRDAWFATGKPVYRFVTRKLLHWEDNEGQGPKP